MVEPTVANDITTKNSSAVEPARAYRPDHERGKSLEPQDQRPMQTWHGCLAIIGYFAELQELHAMSEDCPGCIRRDRDRPNEAVEDVQVSTPAKVEPDEGWSEPRKAAPPV